MNVPDGWKQVDLGSIISIISDGGTPSRAVSRYFGGDIPWIVIDDIKDDIYETTECLTEMGLSACSSNYWDEGTVILSTGATIGVVGITRVKAATKQGICGIEFKNSIDNKYMMYLLKSMRKTFLAYSQGSTIREIRPTLIKKLEVQIPQSLTEQRQIARILSKVDEAISQTEQLIAKYRRLKTGLMQDLLTKGIDKHGNIRREETHAFEVKDGFKYPVEWQLTTIEKSIESIQQGWSPNCDSDPAPTGEWGVLKTTAVTWNGYDGNENKRMPINLIPKRQYEVKNGDVLVTRAGPNSRVGVVSYVEHTRSRVIFSDKIYRVVPKNILMNKYLAMALSSEFTQRHLSNLKTGMAESQTNISHKIILSLNIILPTTDEQEQIILTLDKAEASIKRIADNIAKLQSLKTGLMQDLLSGKVRVGQLIPETVEAC